MRRLAVPFAVAVFCAAVLAAFSGRWPWRRPMLAASPITVSESWLATSDTLRRGETLGDLFARQGLVSLDLGRLNEIGLDARRLRAGLVFNFRRTAGEEEPSRIEVRTGPEERLRLEREDDRLGRRARNDPLDPRDRPGRGLRSAPHSTRRSTRRCPTRSSTPASE